VLLPRCLFAKCGYGCYCGKGTVTVKVKFIYALVTRSIDPEFGLIIKAGSLPLKSLSARCRKHGDTVYHQSGKLEYPLVLARRGDDSVWPHNKGATAAVMPNDAKFHGFHAPVSKDNMSPTGMGVWCFWRGPGEQHSRDIGLVLGHQQGIRGVALLMSYFFFGSVKPVVWLKRSADEEHSKDQGSTCLNLGKDKWRAVRFFWISIPRESNMILSDKSFNT